ncbi:MAG: type II toxin-antitoxin system HipA family toxin [Thermoflexibacteraceae bacterium]
MQDVATEHTFCSACSRNVFKRKMSAILPFSMEDLTDKLPSQLQKNSLLGYQNKIYLKLKIDGNWKIPQWGKSSHLLKLPNVTLGVPYKLAYDMSANEHLSIQIAKQIFKIPTVECAFLYTEDRLPLYITKLFDVSTAKDFAVLLSTTSDTHGNNYKYEGNYEEIANYLTQHSEDKQTDLFNFFKSLVLSLIIRNGDAHLRNFSMFYNEKSLFTLTPLYDVLNTVLHLDDESMACYLYKNDNKKINIRSLNRISRKKIIEFASIIGLHITQSDSFLAEIATKQTLINTLIDKSFLSQKAKELYQDYVDKSYRVFFR